MTFLERLQAHKGGLIRLKTQLYWYGDRGWDGNPGRLCVMLEAAAARAADPVAALATHAARFATVTIAAAVTHLLLDGRPQWVWVAEEDVEFIDESR